MPQVGSKCKEKIDKFNHIKIGKNVYFVKTTKKWRSAIGFNKLFAM